MRLVRSIFGLFLLASASWAANPLRIYFVDVEGGQATLLVAPNGQTMLIDTGFDSFGGRDAVRIEKAMKDADKKKLDYLVITHFHPDHAGGVKNIVGLFPVGTFIDHGTPVDTNKYSDDYAAAIAKSKHQVVTPGDKITMKDLTVTIAAAAGKDRPGTGTPNRWCEGLTPRGGATGEDPQSVGLLIELGKFRFFDPGDLPYDRLLGVLCPTNQIGKIDLYLPARHGAEGPKATYDMAARVAVVNNAARKGGAAAGWKVLSESRDIDDIWQLHYAVDAGGEGNSRDAVIANLVPSGDEDGKFLKVEALPDGSFTVTNTRNKYLKKYGAR